MKNTKKLASLVCVALLALCFFGCQSKEAAPAVTETSVAAESAFGLKVGDNARIPFTSAITFDTVASDVAYNDDGSVTYIATAAGGAGGGLAFYLNEDTASSIMNTANYESCDIELSYAPVEGKWTAGAQDPGFCLRLLTSDSTGIFGGAVDVEYFDTGVLSGDYAYTVKFPETLSATVVDAADYDGIKAFCIKFNDYQRGHTDNFDQLKVTIKSITFNKKAGAPADVPFDDGLTDAQRGSVVSINYPTQDYAAGDGTTYDKHAWVYLPAGYDAADTATKYPVFVLLHGFGQNENTWGLSDQGDGGKIKGYMDRGMADGSVKPFILVVATGVASKNWGPNGAGDDFNGYNAFGPELRNDLLPYIYANFNCAEGRDNTALAGLSMGGGQTLTIGIAECLDIIGNFGAFSAAAFVGANDFINQVNGTFPDTKINTLYMICGDADFLVYGSYPEFTGAFSGWDKIENFSFDTVPGGTHDFPVWFKGFKNFITKIFN